MLDDKVSDEGIVEAHRRRARKEGKKGKTTRVAPFPFPKMGTPSALAKGPFAAGTRLRVRLKGGKVRSTGSVAC